MTKEGAIVIFAKAPDVDTVKTRLKSALSDDERLRLYISLMENAIGAAKAVTTAAAFIACWPPDGAKWFADRYALPVFPQEGEDLGSRMSNAIERALAMGYGKVVIAGTDVPDMTCEVLRAAFSALDKRDIVIGPAVDGGYYLIGLKRLCRRVFEDIEWSGETVLSRTLERAKEAGLSVGLLVTLSDIDRPEDLSPHIVDKYIGRRRED
jgi:hypothetical protein